MYTVRPSIITSSLLASAVLKPRALIPQSWAFFWATSRLSARRSASGILVAPERRMSSRVMTWMAAARLLERFRMTRHGGHLDVHELLHAHVFQLTRGVPAGGAARWRLRDRTLATKSVGGVDEEDPVAGTDHPRAADLGEAGGDQFLERLGHDRLDGDAGPWCCRGLEISGGA